MNTPLNVLVLNASLKRSPDVSNTEEVAELVLTHLHEHAEILPTVVRLADKNIPAGLDESMGEEDEWPAIAQQVRDADIVLFATPIWWGGRSSLMQRVIERMDAFDTDEKRAELLNKVAGIVITGSEDGAQHVMAGLMEFLSFMNFTLPPQCCTYWVGEVGMDPKTDRDRRLANKAVDGMARKTAKSLAFHARLLREHPQLA